MSQTKNHYEAKRWLATADMEIWQKRAAALDKFYIPTRYPNGLPDLTPGQSYFLSDAEEAISQATFFLNASCRLLEENTL